MEASSPAKLYATLVGTVLTIAGIIGFFYSGNFGSPGAVEKVFGILAVNGWHNVVHLATGLLGLAAAGYAARQYALGLGLVYIAVAIWGFIIGSGDAILSIVPALRERPPPTGRSVGPDRLEHVLRGGPKTGRPAAPAHADEHERAPRDRAHGDRGDRAHPVARVAERLPLTLGKLLGPARELGRGLLGDRRQRALDAADEVLWRLDRAQRVAEQRLQLQVSGLFAHLRCVR